jgi:hypothetical protein
MARIRTLPSTIGSQLRFTLSRFRPLWMVPRMSAPTSVPNTVPRPPVRVAPPMTTAEMASSSALKPDDAVPESVSPAWITPARPAARPPSAKTEIETARTGMPTRSPASRLPPTA